MSSDSNKGLILSVNAGSSSLKISLFRILSSAPIFEPVELILESNTTSLTAPPAKFSFSVFISSPTQPPPHIDSSEIPAEQVSDHKSAFAFFLKHLRESAGYKESDIRKVCHRVVHGGDYRAPAMITDESYDRLERLSDLAPLHNGAALSVIRTAIEALPEATSIAYFDTAFHATIPPQISSYMINPEIAKERGLRKYGFHGLSYAYILRTVSHHLSQPSSQSNLIVLHLGSGASICAIKNGQSLDTSMGLTPVSGLPGATRAGDVDGSLIFHYLTRGGKKVGNGSVNRRKEDEKEGEEEEEENVGRLSHQKLQGIEMHVTRAEEILNKENGWKSLAGTTDFGTVVQRRNSDINSPKSSSSGEGDGTTDLATLAYDIFIDRILNFIGSYYVKLGGRVDALVFAGGIGERSVEVRESVVQGLESLGFGIDRNRNEGVKKARKEGGEKLKVVDVSAGEVTDKKVLVCWTDEQFEMARECTLEEKFWA